MDKEMHVWILDVTWVDEWLDGWMEICMHAWMDGYTGYKDCHYSDSPYTLAMYSGFLLPYGGLKNFVFTP